MTEHLATPSTGGHRIPLRGLPNTRDLGGIETSDGRRIQMKRLLRSGALATATAQDLVTLIETYDLRTIIDFRDTTEKMQTPDPVPEGVRHVQLPIFEAEQKGITREGIDTTVQVGDEEFDVMAGTTVSLEDHGAPEDEATIDRLEKEVIHNLMSYLSTMGDRPLDNLRDGYRLMVTNPHSLNMYRAFLQTLLDQPEGSVLYHCAAGKDRVGLGTLFVLSALGVPEPRILDDYLYTNACYERQIELLKEAAREMGTSDNIQDQIGTMMGVERSLIDASLEIIHRDYGDVPTFMRYALAFSDADREKLRTLYLEG